MENTATKQNFLKTLRNALTAAIITFLLFVVIVGVKISPALKPSYNFWTVFTLSVLVGGGYLLLDLFVWGRQPHHGSLFQTEKGRTALLIALGIFFISGFIFLFFPSVRIMTSAYASSLFSTFSWGNQFGRIIGIIQFLSISVFIVMTFMFLAFFSQKILKPDRYNLQSFSEFFEAYRHQFSIALFLVAITFPLLALFGDQEYALRTGRRILTYVMLGWGLNIVVGLAGLLDLGYVAFYAVGAYSYAFLSDVFGLSFWVCLPLAGMFAATWGMILGFPVLRLRGDYLAIVTMAFGEIIRVILIGWEDVTGGGDGINAKQASFSLPAIVFFAIYSVISISIYFLPLKTKSSTIIKFLIFAIITVISILLYAFGWVVPAIKTILYYIGMDVDIHAFHPILTYYLILMMSLVLLTVSSRMRSLPLGRAWEALREDEIACRTLGINTTTTKLTAFAMGAMFAGFAGTFFAADLTHIEPKSFTFVESAKILAIVVLGGMGSHVGIAIAAVVLVGAEELFRDFGNARMLIFGLAMMLIMIWRPRGLVSTRTPSIALKEGKAISGSLVKEGAG
jgi:branched-chain amino acid transport system permease protein